MPLMSSLYIGASGLQTSQNALNTTAHNLTNVDTTGYTRQQVQQGTRTYITLSVDPKSVANKQYGQGTYYFKTGSRYDGEFQYGFMQGYGVYQKYDGHRYEGNFLKGKYEGFGVADYPDGSRYEGQWKQDERCGHGKLTNPDGTVWEGEFLNNEPRIEKETKE